MKTESTLWRIILYTPFSLMLYILSVTKCHYIVPLRSLHQLPCTRGSFLPSDPQHQFPAHWKASYLAFMFFVLYTSNPILCIAISWNFLKSKSDCAIPQFKSLKEIPIFQIMKSTVLNLAFRFSVTMQWLRLILDFICVLYCLLAEWPWARYLTISIFSSVKWGWW